jgi:hypothetical protein
MIVSRWVRVRRSVERIELPSTSRLRMRSFRSGRAIVHGPAPFISGQFGQNAVVRSIGPICPVISSLGPVTSGPEAFSSSPFYVNASSV